MSKTPEKTSWPRIKGLLRNFEVHHRVHNSKKEGSSANLVSKTRHYGVIALKATVMIHKN